MNAVAYDFLGETSIQLGKRNYILRPSLKALYSIEQKMGGSLADILTLLVSQPCNPQAIRFILYAGLHAKYGSRHLPSCSYRAWKKLQLPAARFLCIGSGITLPDMALPGAETCKTLVAPDWPILYQTAMNLGFSEAQFWHTTLPGLILATKAHRLANGEEGLEIGAPATSHEVHDMMKRFPDEARDRGVRVGW